MGAGRIFQKTQRLFLMMTYLMSLILAGSISQDSTFKVIISLSFCMGYYIILSLSMKPIRVLSEK